MNVISPRITEMLSHWKNHHWAKSNLSNDDNDFYKSIRMKPLSVSTTSFTGNDIIYYKSSKVIPWGSSMISISQYKKNLKKRK